MSKFNTPWDCNMSLEVFFESNKNYVNNLNDSIGYIELSVMAKRMGQGRNLLCLFVFVMMSLILLVIRVAMLRSRIECFYRHCSL